MSSPAGDEPFVCRQNCDRRFKTGNKRAGHEKKCRLGIDDGRKRCRKAIDKKLAGKTEEENAADQMALFAMSMPQQQQQGQQQGQQQQQSGGVQQLGGGGGGQQQQQQQQQGEGEDGTGVVQEELEEADKMEVDEDNMVVDEEGDIKAQDEQKVGRELVLAQVMVEVGAADGEQQTVEVKVEDANSGSVFAFLLASDAWLVFE